MWFSYFTTKTIKKTHKASPPLIKEHASKSCFISNDC